jgi:hypothetical protein
MKTITYHVNTGETFEKSNFPEVRQEIEQMADFLLLIPGNHKSDIIISYCKDHCIRAEYIVTNKRVVDKILSGSLNYEYTEALFVSCREQSAFLNGFEAFIRTNFT